MHKGKIIVALSGGVDSGVAAYLLKQEGWEVIGVYLQVWQPPAEWFGERSMRSPTTLTISRARLVAETLGIKLITVDISRTFYQKIVEPFVQQYLQGKTPNPCVVCNEEIKLAVLLEQARELGASAVATGHYARVEFDQKTGRYVLLRGIDHQKDQSYYLGRIKAERLPWFKTPLGNQTKETTRKIAQAAGLWEVVSRESQDICFVPEQDYRQFIITLARFMLGKEVQKPGPIYNTEGRQIGEHQGIIFYTIGQRKGLGISASHPLYVIEIDPQRNAVIAGNREQIFAGGLIGEEANWVSINQPSGKIEVEVQVRYHHPPATARLIPTGNDKVEVRFQKPQPAVTPGQLAVFYRGEMLLGSAFISKSLRPEKD